MQRGDQVIINIYVLTPEKVMDIKNSLAWIKHSIGVKRIITHEVIEAIDKIDGELSKACRIKKVDPKNFV